MSKVNPVTCLFSRFEALDHAFGVQIFQGFIFTPFKDTDSMKINVAQMFKSINKLLNNALMAYTPD